MNVYSKKILLPPTQELDIIDITDEVGREVGTSGIQNGLVTIFVSYSTAAVTTLEYESGLVADMRAMLERLIPSDYDYEHHKKWHDNNGHSHIRSAFLGPSLTVPIHDGALSLGTWQQIVFIELDSKARRREAAVTIVGE